MHSRGGHQVTLKNNCLTGTKRKTWLGNPPVFHKNSGIEKLLRVSGVVTIFRRKFLVSRRRKIFVVDPCFSDMLIRRSFYWIVGLSRIPRKFFVSGCQRISQGNPSLFQNNSGIEGFHAYEGGVIIVLSKIFCFTGPKIFVKVPFCVPEIFGYG